MDRIAAVLLTLPHDLVVVQRRSVDAPVAPLKLSCFGGHIVGAETPLEAAKRELGEETSLNVSKLTFEPLTEIKLAVGPDQPDPAIIYVFRVAIPSPDFEVFEGKAEVHPLNDLRSRIDTVASLQYITQQT